MADALAQDALGTAAGHAAADKLYQELSMVALPHIVDDWIIAHCHKYKYGITVQIRFNT